MVLARSDWANQATSNQMGLSKPQTFSIENSTRDKVTAESIKSNQNQSKKNLYSAVYSTDLEALGGRIK